MEDLEAEHVPGLVGQAHQLAVLEECLLHSSPLKCEALRCTTIDMLSAGVSSLFLHYSNLYFDDSLGACSVEWSSARMTRCGCPAFLLAAAGRCTQSCCPHPVLHLSNCRPHAVCRCAGTCQYDHGGGCRIKLSEPLLKVGPQPPCLPDAQGSSCGLPVAQAHQHSWPRRQPSHSHVPVLRAVPSSAGAQRGKPPACTQG